jgi:osmotically-inducible protein OsmY
MTQLSDRIEDELARQAEIYAAVEERGSQVVLSGIIENEGLRQAAFDIVRVIAPDKRIIDNLEIDAIMPGQVDGLDIAESVTGGSPEGTDGTSDTEAIEAVDFTDQVILNDPDGAAGPGDTTSDEDISEGEEVYVPPLDPPSDGADRVINGFSLSAMDSISVAPSASDNKLGDEAIADAVRRELREDAATTELRIRVHVEQGIVRLRGTVQDILDTENAEEVASRVPGVIEVIEELEVQTGAF